MKMKLWSVLTVMVTTSLLAQPATTPPPAIEKPAPAPTIAPPVQPEPAQTTAPAAKPAKKKSGAKKLPTKHAAQKKPAEKPAPELKTVPLVAGPAVVAASHVNIRAKAGLIGEVIAHMTNGEPVTVIEEITLKKSKPDEPSAWVKIALPASAHVWVNASFIDATNKTVLAKKLNLRGGPGENYGVLGLLTRGDAVKEIETKGDWMEIEAPTSAYAYMAAQYLKQEAPTAVAATVPAAPAPAAPVEPAPMPTTVAENPTVAPAPTETPAVPAPAPVETPAVPAPAPAATAVVSTETQPAPAAPAVPPSLPPRWRDRVREEPKPPAAPAVEEPMPPRIVDREGIVRGTISIQAPTRYELISPDNQQTINYLYTTATNLDLSRYKGMRIIVTGEEGLDERWKNTPIITIRRIQVLQ
jgi:uncharacterized protein YgiM (DUF1202 family)